jgi:hypothetical protein
VHLLLRIVGVDDLSGPWYGFWSGIAGDLVYLGIFWALIRRHNCHVTRCWRVGRFPAGEYRVCYRHHPGPPVTQRTVSERYHLYLGRQPGKG